MKFGIVVFPGSNCDDDMMHVLGNVMQQETVKIWHKETQLDGFAAGDCIVLPGGFSFGDYLRSGAIARFSPIMNAVVDFANNGGLVYGICNGFQILCEAGLLPGVLLRNSNQQYICKNVFLKTISNNRPLTAGIHSGQVLKIPIAHGDGRFYADPETLAELEANDQILFKYCEPNGEITPGANPNGALDNIAGICNKQRNVFGMMPHPERASEEILGNSDGHRLFDSLVKMTHMSASM
jgi:phosphoribosylformylglycinamidine synthase subunit PurQ / glutaminase